MMEKQLPKTVIRGLKICLKVHLITRHLYSIRWSSKEFQIKIANEKTQVELCKHLLTINVRILKISTAQRRQIFLKLAKDEFKMKEAMVASLEGSATQTSKAMDKIAESISSFGKALGDGLAMIAMAMAPINSSSQPNANV